MENNKKSVNNAREQIILKKLPKIDISKIINANKEHPSPERDFPGNI